MVELCAKNLQIMRNDFTDYALTFGQLCANYAHLPRKVVNNMTSAASCQQLVSKKNKPATGNIR